MNWNKQNFYPIGLFCLFCLSTLVRCPWFNDLGVRFGRSACGHIWPWVQRSWITRLKRRSVFHSHKSKPNQPTFFTGKQLPFLLSIHSIEVSFYFLSKGMSQKKMSKYRQICTFLRNKSQVFKGTKPRFWNTRWNLQPLLYFSETESLDHSPNIYPTSDIFMHSVSLDIFEKNTHDLPTGITKIKRTW